MYLLTCLIFLIGYLYLKHLKAMKFWKNKGINYVEPVPILGSMYPMVAKKLATGEFMRYLYNQFPQDRYCGAFQLTTPVLLVRDPDLIKQVLVKNFDYFVDHSSAVEVDGDPVWSKNVIALRGNKWRYVRSILSPMFTGSKMRMMFGLVKGIGQRLVDHFKQSTQEVIPIEMKDVSERFALDVLASCALGIQIDSIKSPNHEFITITKDLNSFEGVKKFKFMFYGYFPTLCRFLGLTIVTKRLAQFYETITLGTIKERQAQNIVRPDLLHLLMEARQSANSQLSDDDLVAQTIVFALGGFDTTSTAIFSCCYELAVNPHVQTTLRNEICSTLARHDNNLTYEGLMQMKYLDMVVCETLRKWPPVNWVDRKCTKAYLVEPQKPWEKPFTIDKSQDIWVPVVALHYDPQYFPEPDLFDPERFSDENKCKIRPFTYMPFAEGPRNCLGTRFGLLNFKVFIFSILSAFEIVTNEKTMIPMRASKETFMLRVDGGCQLSLKRLS